MPCSRCHAKLKPLEWFEHQIQCMEVWNQDDGSLESEYNWYPISQGGKMEYHLASPFNADQTACEGFIITNTDAIAASEIEHGQICPKCICRVPDAAAPFAEAVP